MPISILNQITYWILLLLMLNLLLNLMIFILILQQIKTKIKKKINFYAKSAKLRKQVIYVDLLLNVKLTDIFAKKKIAF